MQSLGSLIDFVNGYPFKPEDWGRKGTPIVRIANLNGSQEFNYYSGGIPQRFHVNEGDLLFCWSGSRGSSFGPRIWAGPLGFLNQHIFRCAVSERVNPDFAFHLLREMTTSIEAQAHGGGGLVHIKKSDLVKFEAWIPPLDEQRRIAEVLQSVDKAIALNLQTLKQVERSRKAILFAAFEAADWELVSLGELGKWRSGGTPPKDETANWHGEIPWICPRDMKVPIIGRSNTTITAHALRGSLKTVSSGTLLLVVRGMILAGAIPTAITAVEASFNQDIKAFIPNGRASPRFVQLCIQHQEERLLRAVNTATHGTKKLDSDTIESIAVPLPDRTEQDALVEMISRLDEATVHYGVEHIRLNQVKSGLLAELLSGRVRVPA